MRNCSTSNAAVLQSTPISDPICLASSLVKLAPPLMTAHLSSRPSEPSSHVKVGELAGLVVAWQVADERVVPPTEPEVERPCLTRRHTADLTYGAGLVGLVSLEQVAGGLVRLQDDE